MKLKLISVAIIVSLAGCASAGTSHAHPHRAPAGYWKLNPLKCPDLVEDWRDRRESRIDEAYDRGPRDVREDIRDRIESRRDEAVTYCPPSAWEWHGPQYRPQIHAHRPVKVRVFYNPHRNHYYHRHGGKAVLVKW
ncbi:MAG: hypothetical protein HKN36_06505 [Hellea sp.]|nr:hypothetical protein [Hellea sp.]